MRRASRNQLMTKELELQIIDLYEHGLSASAIISKNLSS